MLLISNLERLRTPLHAIRVALRILLVIYPFNSQIEHKRVISLLIMTCTSFASPCDSTFLMLMLLVLITKCAVLVWVRIWHASA